MLTHHTAILMTYLLAAFVPTINTTVAADDLPNIVWIISDDLSPDLGCYGYQGVSTPNIDQLAHQGVRYTNAFSTSPVCSSSRSAFITGVYQTATGTHQHRTLNKKPLSAPVRPVTELLRQAGYFVCNGNTEMTRNGKSDYNFSVDGKMYDAADWSKRKPGQPFFAQVQIHEPHRDFVKAKDPARAAGVKIPSYYPEHPLIRLDWADYLESVETLDRHVGNVLERLKRENLVDNTVIFFFGDHGRPHYRDKQWLYDGGLRVPLIVRHPGNRQAGEVRSYQVSLLDVSAATVSLAGIDVPPWMHGQDMLADGFVGHKTLFAARDRCGSTLDRVRCVRTDQFKYIRNFYPQRPYSQHSGYKVLQYPGQAVAHILHIRGELTEAPAHFWTKARPTEELYDVLADPEEVHNLASDAAHSHTLQLLRKALNGWIETTNDHGRLPETDESHAVESSIAWFEAQMKKRGLAADVDPESYLNWWMQQFDVE